MPKHFQRRVQAKRSKFPQLITLNSSSDNILDSRPPPSTSPRPSTSAWKTPTNEEISTPPTSPNSSVRPRYSPASSTRDSDSMRKSCDENKRRRSYSRSRSYSPRSKRPNKKRHLSLNKSQPQDQNLDTRSPSSESHSRSTTTPEHSNDQSSTNGDRQVIFESAVSTSSKSSDFSIDTSGNDLPTIREYLGQPKARGRQTKRRLNAILNHARLQRPRTWHPPIGSLVPAKEFTKRPHLIGFSSLLQRMLESQDPTMDPITFPTFELSEDAEYLEECFNIKQKHQLVPSCRRAIYDEEALMMSIALRIRCYGNGTNWFIGAKADHGPSRVGETRTKAQRIRAVLKSKRADFMRQTGLMSRSDVETVALTFHGHLFDLGATFTDAGGIPGCPGPLTALQRQDCRASLEAAMEYMVELHRRRMEHAAKSATGTIQENQKYADKSIYEAAAELNRCCDGLEIPQYAIDQYDAMFGEDADTAPRPQGIIENNNPVSRRAVDRRELIPHVETLAKLPQLTPLNATLLPNAKRVPGDHCLKARQYLRGRVERSLDCPDDTCVIGSKFLKTILPTDNMRPELPAYMSLTFKDAGAKSAMRDGICDLRMAGSQKVWHLEKAEQWESVNSDMKGYGFIDAIKGHNYLTIGVENYVKGDIVPGPPTPNGSKRRPFTTIHVGSPGGGILAIHCQFNGRGYDGLQPPKEIRDLLSDPDVACVQFGIKDVIDKLTSGGIHVNNWVEAKNIAMIAYPQPGVRAANMKNGKPFVAEMLDAPTRIYNVQARDRDARKARASGSKPNPPWASVPADVPNIRGLQSKSPLYTNKERQLRRDHWDKAKNPLDIPIDFDSDDFTMSEHHWNTRMWLYIAHQHSLINALNWRMCYRTATLHGISMEADSIRYTQFVLLSLKEVEAFTDKVTPSDKAFRPLGNNEWMSNEESRPDVTLRARPYYATEGFSGKTSTKCIAGHFGTRQRKFAVDWMGLSEGFRDDLENINGGKLERVAIEFKIIAQFQRQKVRPHRCSRCGSGNHMEKSCLVPDNEIKCVYPRCKSDKHNILVCPVVINRCTGCEKLGHHKSDHPRTLYPVLFNDYLAASFFHHLGIFTCEHLSVSMGTDAGEFVVIPEIDYSDDKYVSRNDRRFLATLPYNMPYSRAH